MTVVYWIQDSICHEPSSKAAPRGAAGRWWCAGWRWNAGLCAQGARRSPGPPARSGRACAARGPRPRSTLAREPVGGAARTSGVGSAATSVSRSQTETDFFKVKVWDSGAYKLAELCGEYLAKGRRVTVRGRLRQERWADQDNNRRSAVVIVADDVIFLDSPNREERPAAAAAPAPAAVPPTPTSAPWRLPALRNRRSIRTTSLSDASLFPPLPGKPPVFEVAPGASLGGEGRASESQPPQAEARCAERLITAVCRRLVRKAEHEGLLGLEDAVQGGCRCGCGSDPHAGRPESKEHGAGDTYPAVAVQLLDVLEKPVEQKVAPAPILVLLRVVRHEGTVTGDSGGPARLPGRQGASEGAPGHASRSESNHIP